jgi:hypothetical protein
LRFQYDHALSRPLIWPPIKADDQAGFSVEAEEALVFGMLEAMPTVKTGRLVYDPQKNPPNLFLSTTLPTHLAASPTS